jgi:hypothetical protein
VPTIPGGALVNRSNIRSAWQEADLVCLSHLRWNFVYQRPNHLMARASADRRVFFVEEPEYSGSVARMDTAVCDGVTVVRPIVPENTADAERVAILRSQLDRFLASQGVREPWLWYYTPMALPWTSHVPASAVIYDCMDELSGFKFCPPELRERERELIARADVLFTGGRSLFEAKRGLHRNTFLFPSSVDAAHFNRARQQLPEPADQASIPHPRIGYFGVIDERIDLDLIAEIAQLRPDWHIVMVGPLAKIGEEQLPRAANIHWLGLKSYAELPAYLGGWDVAIMPFALNESTLHISPTKTPEYLSGGRPVVSTAIRDVVRPYGEEGLVAIAEGADQFVASIQEALTGDTAELIERADRFLATQSWAATWKEMDRIASGVGPRPAEPPARPVERTRRTNAPRPPIVDGDVLRVPVSAAGDSGAMAASSGGGSARYRAR